MCDEESKRRRRKREVDMIERMEGSNIEGPQKVGRDKESGEKEVTRSKEGDKEGNEGKNLTWSNEQG